MKKKWYRLDNTAKIFPSITTNRLTTVFRLSAIMDRSIKKALLQEALNRTIKRFPYYQVFLKRGIFWSYLLECNTEPEVQEEIEQPCRRMIRVKDKKLLFRVLHFHNRISVEFSHILTDGNGAMVFLEELLRNYIGLLEEREIESTLLPLSDENLQSETEDSYSRYYNKDIPPPRPGGVGAFHLPGPLLEDEQMRVITGLMQISDIKKVAKEKGLSITELLVTVYLWTLQEFNRPNKRRRYLKPLRLMVPVNLRKMYPSQSMRNFFLTVLPGIDLRLGDYDFDEIAQTVHHYMRVEINDKYINQQISKNVSTEQHPIIRLIPSLIKSVVEKIIYRNMATGKHSGVATNVGIVSLTKELQKRVKGFRFIPNPNPVTKINFGVISYNDDLALTFGSLTKYRTIEKLFFRKLRELGIQVTIEINE